MTSLQRRTARLRRDAVIRTISCPLWWSN